MKEYIMFEISLQVGQPKSPACTAAIVDIHLTPIICGDMVLRERHQGHTFAFFKINSHLSSREGECQMGSAICLVDDA